jgi:hypothetical protein
MRLPQGTVFRGCNHSFTFRLLHLLGLPVAPTAQRYRSERPGRLHHASPGELPLPGCGIATCPTRAIDTAGLSPAGLQPCRLLLPASGSSHTAGSLRDVRRNRRRP